MKEFFVKHASTTPNKKILSRAIAGILLASMSIGAQAAGFSIHAEGSAVNTGNAGAGMAAEAQDASTAFFNPAGLTHIEHEQIVASGNVIIANGSFNGTSVFSYVPPSPLSLAIPPVVQTGNATTQGIFFVPAGYYAKPIGENATLGFGMNGPFGLKTDWGLTNPFRYAGTETQVQVVNFFPAIGVKITDKISLGAAIDVQYMTVDFNSVVTLGNLAPINTDSTSTNHGTSTGIGAHGGILIDFNPQTRLGINYQSRVKHNLTGYSKLEGPILAAVLGFPGPGSLTSDSLNASATLPGSTTVSLFHKLNEKFDIMGTVRYIEWSVLKDITLNNVQTPTGLTNSTSVTNYRDTWRVVLGGNWHVNEKILLRAGVGYDQTPTENAFRDIRLPDGDRYLVSVGAHYQASEQLGLDVGYMHLFIKDGNVNKFQPLNNNFPTNSGVTVTGVGKTHADIIGGQLTWNII